jgi:hypothetical protein
MLNRDKELDKTWGQGQQEDGHHRHPAAWRLSLRKRTALAGETPNRSAAARRDMPPSTAWMILIRKSSDKGFAMRAGLLPRTQGEPDLPT